MPPRRWIDKKNATTYQLFHRSQQDPLIHDPTADDRVLHPVYGPKQGAPALSTTASSASHKTSRNLKELESEFSTENVRKNEGEAANYGIYYDDSKYDYMQHLRELGTAGGNSYFVEAAPDKAKGKGKGMKLEDALRDFSIDDSRSEIGGSASVYGSEYARSTASSYVRKPTYQDQQDVPDVIAGFQPNMDPRLREALEALDDEAFVDDEDDHDIFGELTRNAEEVDPEEFQDTLYEDEDDGWESDATEKAYPQTSDTKTAGQNDNEATVAQQHDPSEMPDHDKPVPDLAPENADWMREFAKFKKEGKTLNNTPAANPDAGTEKHTVASTLFTVGGTPIRKKKRKGALTNPSAYSMTSSALARTEGLRLLDDRFERVEALYALDEEGEYDDASCADGASMISGMTGATGMTGMSAASSQAPSLVSRGGDYSNAPLPSNFDNVMDDFLSGWQDRSKQAKRKGAKGKRGKNGNEVLGIAMLDEIRQGLGPARVPARGKA
ncbi:low-temperature viability protein ltv1 [Talaromyces stipitatus ATCC 10500]|uniref:Low-temperature viability protein ltv1 n=1 Tax=Talaromyces stipitatus (strain ATCC 10500 / CBS 375.48 / QM 6759 / NRRL 1006) TaxID=441959 RepID=B8MBQ8_TALSN|nr:low-temperature viability protein ltv1 [Talaromyces stipitatus ATCC 10500]EED18191.1 low-temperature viability protein ltv1 [Talaromyces stipitatus ATCC 10500]